MTARAKPKPLVIPEAKVQAAARWEIAIPAQPPRLNQLMHCHWAVAQKRKNSWCRTIGLLSSHVPKASVKRRVSLKVTLTSRQRGGDVDAYWKATLDGLVRNGLLKDDSHLWTEISPVTFDRGNVKMCVITLEDMP